MNDAYEILSGKTKVAVWQNERLTVLNPDLLPLYFQMNQNLKAWLTTRAADNRRPHIRLLKKALRLTERDDISTVIHVNGATITDNYWIRPLGSDLTYDDVRFTDDYFSNLALKGNYDSFNRAASSKRSKTPELTNIGSFEKCWKLRDGQWWMFKRATHDEMFSELFVYELGRALGMNMAVYKRGDGCVQSLDFTNAARVNFEPASTFMGDNEDYPAVIEQLRRLCPTAIPDYVRMIFLDTVTANPDRHTNNFGLLRDTQTGKLLGLAPNFDNNMALIARGYPKRATEKDLLVRLFNECMDAYPSYRVYMPVLTVNTVRGVLDQLRMRVRSQEIVELVMGRYDLIKA